MKKSRKGTNPFHSYLYRAVKADLPFTLKESEVFELIAQPCEYCGKPSNGTNNRHTGMGIDRVDCRLGYTRRNCVPSCQRCNSVKAGYEGTMSPEEAIAKTRERVNGYSPTHRAFSISVPVEVFKRWESKAEAIEVPVSHWARDLILQHE